MLVATKRPRKNPFKPSPQFLRGTHPELDSRNDQAVFMDSTSEQWLKAQILVSRGNVKEAHALIDDIARGAKGQCRYRDIHLADLGLSRNIGADIEQTHTHTIGDLAYSNPVQLARQMDLIDVLRLSFAALRKLIELQEQP